MLKYRLLLLLILLNTVLIAQENWVELFTDSELSDFTKLNGTADFVFEDGILTGTTKHNTPNTFLATKKKYSNFILEFEVKIEYGMNSGVQFRSNTVDDKPTGRVFGYQAEIETSPRKWAGGVYDEARRGWLYPLTHNPKGQNAFTNGTWNKYRIEAVGNHIKTWVNGIQCANLVDDATSEGFIAFQVHGIWKELEDGKKVQWKNARILTKNIEKALLETKDNVFEMSYLTNQLTENEIRTGWRLLWDGKTTNGWRSAKNNQFPEKGWKVENGTLQVEASDGGESNNGGDIITVEQFSNFELCLDFKISKGANSGIKYFVDPNLNKGSGSAFGLEFQILDDAVHPDAKKGVNDNRTMGALYDLIPPKNLSEANRDTKRVNGNNFNRARIIVKDGKVEHWLNEVKIVEYNRYAQVFDALIAHSKYKDLKGFGQQNQGHILLQDHGDLVEFKNIKIREF